MVSYASGREERSELLYLIVLRENISLFLFFRRERGANSHLGITLVLNPITYHLMRAVKLSIVIELSWQP